MFFSRTAALNGKIFIMIIPRIRRFKLVQINSLRSQMTTP